MKFIGVAFNPTIIAITFISVLAAFAMTSCAEKKPTGLTTADYQVILHERDSVINDWMVAFSDIQTSLDDLKEREQIITMTGEGELTKRGKDAILDDIESINTLLDQNKDRIGDLEASLKKSGIQVSSFRKQVDRLSKDLESRQATIVSLEETIVAKDNQIVGLFNFVDTLNSQLAVQDEVLTETENELAATNDMLTARVDDLHTGYILTGKSKELKAAGLIDTRLLGPKTLNSEMSTDAFVSVDTRELKQIPLQSGKAELITYHPEGSYNLVEDKDNKAATLEIVNPDEFWEVSKYLVVSLK